jgi:hypothetical protein
MKFDPEARRAARPALTYDEALPVNLRRPRSARRYCAPGGRHLRRDRLGQDHATAEDLPRNRARPQRPDRPHPAAPDCGAGHGDAHLAGTEVGTRPPCRLQDPLHRQGHAVFLHQADDRRHPARRNPDRSAAAPVRHDPDRRSPRAQPQHRFPARLPQATAAEAARPEAHRHLGHAGRRAFQQALRGTQTRPR